MDLIDRYKKWRLTHSNESDSESESDSDQQNNSDDSDWNMTIKGSSTTPYIEQLNDNDQLLDNSLININVNNGSSMNNEPSKRSSPVKEQRSPVKEIEPLQHQQRRSLSPQKSPNKESPTRSLAHTGGVAKSDLNIVSPNFGSEIDPDFNFLSLFFSPGLWNPVETPGQWRTSTNMLCNLRHTSSLHSLTKATIISEVPAAISPRTKPQTNLEGGTKKWRLQQPRPLLLWHKPENLVPTKRRIANQVLVLWWVAILHPDPRLVEVTRKLVLVANDVSIRVGWVPLEAGVASYTILSTHFLQR